MASKLKNPLKVSIVKESHPYDDLMGASPKTRSLLRKTPKTKSVPEIPKSPHSSRQKKPSLPNVKVKVATQYAADSFANFVRQSLSAKQKKIVFYGRYNETTKRASVVAPVRKSAGFQYTDLTPQEKEKRKKAKTSHRRKLQRKARWNTDDFFKRHWIDMPPFENEEQKPFAQFSVSFANVESHKAWLRLTGEVGTSIWFGQHDNTDAFVKDTRFWIGRQRTNTPRYPVYIISKGRSQYGPLTAKVLRRLNVPFYLMVEPHEYNKYRTLCDWATDVLVIGESNHGMGPGRARNACWDHAKNVLKTKRHWVLDDNIADFFRLHQNERIRVADGTIFRAAEAFVDRYENIAVAGFAYKFFHVPNLRQYPFKLNTRIYSCLLIDNKCPYRWRGRYNEDTILSLDVLKDMKKHKTHQELNAKNKDGSYQTPRNKRLTTVEFVAFLQGKLNTQVQKGGNTTAFYKDEGTGPKSMMLAETHPDVARVEDMFGRLHHKSEYTLFRSNWLVRTEQQKELLRSTSWKGFSRPNPYGMVLMDQCSEVPQKKRRSRKNVVHRSCS